MDDNTWNRGDGQPDRHRLDEALDEVLQRCNPVEIVLFGSGARGELGETSDIDLLVVLAGGDPADPGSTSFEIGAAIGYQPRADIVVAFEHDVREAAMSLTSVLRTAREEGVPLYQRGRRLAYAPRSRPEATGDTDADSNRAGEEARQLSDRAKRKLDWAEMFAEHHDPCALTETAGAARKAIELALQAAIVAAGRRPRSWKDPAGLAVEAKAAGTGMPVLDTDALARAANYYTGRAYSGYPAPSSVEATEALELARRIVPWSISRVSAK